MSSMRSSAAFPRDAIASTSRPAEHIVILCICDSPASALVLRQRWPRAILCADNPFLQDLTSNAGAIRNIDALIDQRSTYELGRCALTLVHTIDRKLAASGIPEKYGLSPQHFYLTGGLSRLIASLFHRGAVLAAALSDTDASEVQIGTHDCGRWEARNPLILPWFAHPARALGAAGFFGIRPWGYTAVTADLPKAINEAAADSVVRRAAVMPIQVVAHEATALFRVRGRAGPHRGDICIGETNEALRETLPYLARRGMHPAPTQSVRAARTGSANGFDHEPQVDPEVHALLKQCCNVSVTATGHFDTVQADAITDLVVQHISAGLDHLKGQTAVLRAQIASAFPRGGVLLTNGLFGADGGQAYGLYAEHGVKVVEFEHGVTAGISALTDTKLADNHPPRPALHLVCSETAKRAFTGREADDHTVMAIGLADAVRSVQNAPLQRFLARRKLSLARRERVVMHVSTLPYYANQRPGLGTPSESVTYRIDKTLLTEVYPALPHRTIFKQYPTQRFPYEPRYDEIFALPSNVTVTKDEDFRYMRSAADVIVTMTPTSTLGWCVGTGVPIVWLASRLINPLSNEELHQRFVSACPSVDLDEPDWPERLKALLADLDALGEVWERRKSIRESLYREAITGPPGCTGRRAAEIIAKFISDECSSS